MLPDFSFLGVVGSRTWTDQAFVNATLDKIRKRAPNLCVVSGACPKGADFSAEVWAKDRGNPILLFPADWHSGRGAGFARNGNIVDVSEYLVSFWDGKSNGTMDTMTKALKSGKAVFLSTPDHKPLVRIESLEELKGQYATR